MELSCRTEYALLALLELAGHYPQDEPLQIKQIAAQQQIPERYLEQLLATLRRGGFVQSQRGAKGGYLLTIEPWKITLLDVVNCLEGAEARNRKEAISSLARIAPTLESVVVDEVWQEVYETMRGVLQGYTLQDLCDQRDSRRQMNIMYYI